MAMQRPATSLTWEKCSRKEHIWKRASLQGRDSDLIGGGLAVALWMAQELAGMVSTGSGKQETAFRAVFETHWETTSQDAAETLQKVTFCGAGETFWESSWSVGENYWRVSTGCPSPHWKGCITGCPQGCYQPHTTGAGRRKHMVSRMKAPFL